MNTHPHLEEFLRRDIDKIRAKVSEAAALSEAAVRASVRALTERNRRLAYSIILRDQYIDELETELDKLCFEFLARHQPVASDLRLVFSTIQINRQLERIGDYAESVARQVLVVSELDPQPPFGKFVELGDLAVHMLGNAVQSFLQKDASLATRTMAIEERANTLRTSINGELKELVDTGRLPSASLTPLLTVARRLERVTDQAKNLCEEVLYLCTGEFIRHKSAEGFRILFLDFANSALSQMAEAVAQSLQHRGFQFASAGLTPQPIDARAMQFLASKGLDVSRLSSKSLEQVPDWQRYQVVVCLEPSVRENIPVHQGKTIYFNWPLADPAKAPGIAESNSALETAFQALDSQIRDLVAAILQEPGSNTKTPL